MSQAIESGDAVELDACLVEVRRLVPLTQPTAYRLARLMLTAPSNRIALTDEVQAGLGRVPREWEEDLADLYRCGLLAGWLDGKLIDEFLAHAAGAACAV